MGKSKSVTVGYWYYMGLHFGISHGPVDAVQKVIVGERDAWTGSATSSSTVAINAPELFGGEKREGGVVGNLDIMMGGSTQSANAYLTGQLGSPSPAYRGILGAVFDGKVTALNPYIKPWAFKVKRILQGWASGSAWYSAKAEISGDMNPAHIIYQCLTEPNWGMGYPTSSIDTTSFTAAADALFTESFGLSILWNKQATIEEFIKVVLDHIGGILYVTQDTGRFALKLIRDDYVKANLPLFGPSTLASVTDYQRRGWGETINEITVVFNDAATNKESGVTVQDLANIATQGQVVSQTRRYPGISNATLAQRVAMRDLRNVSLPISRARLTANRSAWNLYPGDPIRLTWPEYGIADVVFRVMEVNRGTLTDGEITVEVVEDIYALPSNSYTQQQTGLWTSPNTQPANFTNYQLIEAPYYEIARTLSEADMAYLTSTSAYLQTVAARNAGDTYGYGIATNASGTLEEVGSGFTCPTAVLVSGITPATTTTTTVTSGVDLSQVVLNTYAIIGAEYVQVTALNTSTGAITMNRGVLDTVPGTHAAGTRIWFAQDFLGTDGIEYASSQNLSVRLLPRTSLGQLAIASATAASITFGVRQNRPYPPGRLRIASQEYPASVTNTTPSISWATRNRLTQTASLVLQSASDIAAEAGTTYSVEIRNATTNTVVASTTGVTTTSYTPPTIYGQFPMRVQLWAVRGGQDSYQRHDYTFDFTNPLNASSNGNSLTATSTLLVPSLTSSISATLTQQARPVGPGTAFSAEVYFTSANVPPLPLPANVNVSLDFQLFGETQSALVQAGTGAFTSFVYADLLNSLRLSTNQDAWLASQGMTASGLFGTDPDYRFTLTGQVGDVWAVTGTQINFGGTPNQRYGLGLDVADYGSGPTVTDTPQEIQLTLSGTPTLGERHVVTLNGTDYQATSQSGDSAAMVAARLAYVIDQSPDYTVKQNGTLIYVAASSVTNEFTYAATTRSSAAYATNPGDVTGTFAPGVILTASSSTFQPPTSSAQGRLVSAASYMTTGKAESNTGADGAAVILLVHADGSSGSTSFTDSSTGARTVTALGSAELSTVQSKFGGASMRSQGVSSGLRVGAVGVRPAGFEAFANNTWTVEGWAYLSINESLGYSTLFSMESASAGVGTLPNLSIATVNSGGVIGLVHYISGVNQVPPATVRSQAPGRNQWFHWAAVCDAGRLRLFVNGQSTIYRQESNLRYDWLWMSPPSIPADCTVYIAKSSTGYFAGTADSYLDEVRISSTARYLGSYDPILDVNVSGTPVYTADFVPPTAAFANPA